MSFPGAEFNIPALNIACGEKPVVLCEEPAKDAPRNFVVDVELSPAAAETFVPNAIHLILVNHRSKGLGLAKNLLFNILRRVVCACTMAVVHVEISFITDFKIFKHNPGALHCRRRKCVHDRTSF
jgi:hypothetical protein